MAQLGTLLARGLAGGRACLCDPAAASTVPLLALWCSAARPLNPTALRLGQLALDRLPPPLRRAAAEVFATLVAALTATIADAADDEGPLVEWQVVIFVIPVAGRRLC